jgi:adenylate cyclase
MAVFGAPISEGNDSRNATAAALEILAELEARNARSGSPPTRVGIGIHAGLAVVGSIGSADRKEFTVIGDVVNLASRVEQLNKQLDSSLLVTEPVYEAVRDDHAGEELAPVTVRGRAEPVRLYRLA